MKAKKYDKELRELFRQKLMNAEIIPDASVGTELMKKVARRNFMRFNPSRFNIYYAGALALAGISAILFLSADHKNRDQVKPPSIPLEITIPDKIAGLNVSDIQDIEQESQNVKPVPGKEKTVSETSNNSEGQSSKTELREKSPVSPDIANNYFSKNGLFPSNTADRNKLQGGFKNDGAIFESSATEGCPPLKVKFRIKTNSYDSCRWSFGDGGFSYKREPEWIFDEEGEYKVMLELLGEGGLRAISSTVITVFSKPHAHFEIMPETAVIPEDEIRFLNYSTNGVSFKWDFGDGSSSDLFEPRHRYSRFGNYNIGLVVSSDHGCADSLTVMNAFSGSGYFIDFPNAFIPNQQGPSGGHYSSKIDEAAQVFHPYSSGVSEYQIKIFSKLGILIFESSDINLGWDGYIKGQLCEPGVYIWKVRGKFRNGEPFTRMGDVTILKGN